MRTITLSPDARLELTRAFAHCGRLGRDPEPFLAAVSSTVGRLPADVLRAILQFRSDPAAPGFLLFRGMPVDTDLPPTPTKGDVSAKETFVSEASILLISLLLGEPVGYADEKDGVLVQNLYPIEAEKRAPSNASSETDLGFTRSSPTAGKPPIALSMLPARIFCCSSDFVPLRVQTRLQPSWRHATSAQS